MGQVQLPSGIEVRIRQDLSDGSRSSTELIIDPMTTKSGYRVTMDDIGLRGYGKIDQNNPREEIISWSGMVDNGSTYTLTGVIWGINFHNRTGNVTANMKRHISGASFSINTDMHYIADNFVNKRDFNATDNSIGWGDGTKDYDKILEARNGTENLPFVMYNETLNKWLISNDGVNTYDPTLGGSGLQAGEGIAINASHIDVKVDNDSGLHINDDNEVSIEYQNNPGLDVVDEKLGVKIKEDTGLVKDADGLWCDSIDPDNPVEQSPAQLIGGTNVVLANFEALEDSDVNGKFSVNIDGVDYNDLEIDLAGFIDENDIALKVQTAIRTATGKLETVVWDTDKFVVTSTVLGKNSISHVGRFTEPTSNPNQEEITTINPGVSAGVMAISDDGETILLGESGGGDGRIVIMSTNRGASWATVTPVSNGWYDMESQAWINNGGTLRFIYNNRGGDYGIYKYFSGSWSRIAQAGGNFRISGDAQNLIYSHVSNGNLLYSSNSGSSFTQILGKVTVTADISYDGTTIVHAGYNIGSTNHRVLVTRNGGSTWTNIKEEYIQPNARTVRVNRDGTVFLYGYTGGGLYITQDDGATWTEIKSSWSSNLSFSKSTDRIYSGNEYSDDYGVTWETLNITPLAVNITDRRFVSGTQYLRIYNEGDISGAGYLDLGANATEIPSDGDDYKLVRLGSNGQIEDEILNNAYIKSDINTLLTDLYEVVASNNLKTSSDTERSTDDESYVMKKEIIFNYFVEGTIRVKFDLKANNYREGYGRIYVNDVVVGTERHVVPADGYKTFTEDITVKQGDKIQIYIKSVIINSGFGSSVRVQNFRLYYDLVETGFGADEVII